MLDDLRTLLLPKLLTARARARTKERGRGARTAVLAVTGELHEVTTSDPRRVEVKELPA